VWQKWSLFGIALLFLALLAHRVWRSAGGTEKRHEHEPGAHGGIIVSLGGDRYHVEAVFTKGGWLKLYTLGPDASRLLEVEVQTLTAHVTPEGDAEAIPVELRSEPQPGDAPGRTSCFGGRLPAGVAGRSLRVSVPNFHISGERLHLAFVRPTEAKSRSNGRTEKEPRRQIPERPRRIDPRRPFPDEAAEERWWGRFKMADITAPL
jgi:hypothetical protein